MGKNGWAWIKLPEKVTNKITQFGREIPKEELHENGREKQPHITIKYGITIDDSKLVKECLEGKTGGTAHLGVSSIFENENYDVIKVSCAGAALHRIHKLLNQLPHDDHFMLFKPHATIAYVKKGFGKKYAGKFLIDEEFEFDTVWFKKPDGSRSVPIRLGTAKTAFNLKRYIDSENH